MKEKVFLTSKEAFEERLSIFLYGMKTWPFYKCKHQWIICWVDNFGTVYKCYKCGKLKNKDWKNKITYIEV